MSELKRTQLFDIHVAAGASMVDFGGWEMPVQYPTGIVAEHLYTRSDCSLFDVSHMGRLLSKVLSVSSSCSMCCPATFWPSS